MNRMIQPAGLWWSSRSVREQRMLAVMGGLILVVLIWLVVVRPAWGWREDAADRRTVAEARLQVIETRLAGAAVATDRLPMALADVEQAARAAAEAAGLEVVLSVAETGRIAFVARGVTSPVLFGWLTALNDDYGVSIQDLSVIENADATLEAVGEIGVR